MREGDYKISSGCAVACIFHKDGTKENGQRIIEAIAMMHDRSNGLGGGFVGYGIYPEHKDAYAFHIFFDNEQAKKDCEYYLTQYVKIDKEEEIPTISQPMIQEAPIIWRYFVGTKGKLSEDAEKELIASIMFTINDKIHGSYVFSCGKNMGVFKGVGYPEDIGRYYNLSQYDAYTWIAHGRYPTNTPGWWAGAHPFSMLDYALVHNGEISSYDTNRVFIEMFGYTCSLLTDTEVITYIFDYLCRKKGMTFEECTHVIAGPFWDEIDHMDAEDKRMYTMLRKNFSSLLITGPFSIILGFDKGIVALNDRLKLRSLITAKKDNTIFLASEESAIRKIQPDITNIESLDGGIPFIARLEDENI